MQCGISSLLYQVFQQGSPQRVGPQEHFTVRVTIHRLAQPPVHIWGLAKSSVREMENLRNIWKCVSADALQPRFLPSNSFYSVFNLWSHSYIHTCPLSSATPTPRSWILAGALPPFLADFSWAFFHIHILGLKPPWAVYAFTYLQTDDWQVGSDLPPSQVGQTSNENVLCNLGQVWRSRWLSTTYTIPPIVFLFFSAWLMLMC